MAGIVKIGVRLLSCSWTFVPFTSPSPPSPSQQVPPTMKIPVILALSLCVIIAYSSSVNADESTATPPLQCCTTTDCATPAVCPDEKKFCKFTFDNTGEILTAGECVEKVDEKIVKPPSECPLDPNSPCFANATASGHPNKKRSEFKREAASGNSSSKSTQPTITPSTIVTPCCKDNTDTECGLNCTSFTPYCNYKFSVDAITFKGICGNVSFGDGWMCQEHPKKDAWCSCKPTKDKPACNKGAKRYTHDPEVPGIDLPEAVESSARPTTRVHVNILTTPVYLSVATLFGVGLTLLFS